MNLDNKPTSIRKATTINFFGKYTNIFIQLIYSAILARILTPSDFGVVAVVTVFTTFFSLIANIGIGPAIIQHRNIDEEDLNNIYSLTIYLGLFIGLLFALFSIPISIFYKDEVYIPIGSLLAISLFFNTINIVPNSLLLKAQRFKLVNLRLVIVSVLSAIPTIVLALVGFKYYSIVIHSILVSFITFLWNFRTVKLKFVFKLDMNSYRKIKEFSSYQFAFSLVNYFSRNLDNLLIGKFIGNSALGFYDKSYRLMLYPVQNLTHVITPVLHPILSAHQEDKKYIYEKYMKVLKVLSLLGVFVSVLCYFAAEEIIVLLYGNQWYDSIPSFQLLALSIWAQMISSSTGSIFQSISNTRLMFLTGIISSALIISAILIGIRFDNINAIAGFVTLAFIINVLISFYYLIKKGLGYSFRRFLYGFIPDFILFVIMFVGLYITSKISFPHLFISAMIKGISAILLFGFGLLVTKQYKVVKQIIGRK